VTTSNPKDIVANGRNAPNTEGEARYEHHVRRRLRGWAIGLLHDDAGRTSDGRPRGAAECPAAPASRRVAGGGNHDRPSGPLTRQHRSPPELPAWSASKRYRGRGAALALGCSGLAETYVRDASTSLKRVGDAARLRHLRAW